MNIRKNLLDLEHQKYLQFYTTTIIIIFTYFIGVGISLLTKQIKPDQIIALLIISIIIIGIATAFLYSFNSNIKRISEEIKKLI